ncbi:MAG TPA: hypothetical protein DEF33_07355 [Clostridiales bacterium]|nr:hypothetical protein [Clostridiales bacterium]
MHNQPARYIPRAGFMFPAAYGCLHQTGNNSLSALGTESRADSRSPHTKKPQSGKPCGFWEISVENTLGVFIRQKLLGQSLPCHRISP